MPPESLVYPVEELSDYLSGEHTRALEPDAFFHQLQKQIFSLLADGGQVSYLND